MLPRRIAAPAIASPLAAGRGMRVCIACRHSMRVAVAALLLAAGNGAAAQEGNADNGPGRSPFLPEGWEQRDAGSRRSEGQEKPSADAKGGYAFNGLLTIGGQTYFSLSNTETQQAMLVRMGDKSHEVQVSSYDPERRAIILADKSGKSEVLALRKSDGEPLTPATAGRSRGAPGQRTMGVPGGTAGTGQPPSIQQRRQWAEARLRRYQQEVQRLEAEAGGQSGSGAVAVGVAQEAPPSSRSRSSRASAQGGSSDNSQSQATQSRRLRITPPQ